MTEKAHKRTARVLLVALGILLLTVFAWLGGGQGDVGKRAVGEGAVAEARDDRGRSVSTPRVQGLYEAPTAAAEFEPEPRPSGSADSDIGIETRIRQHLRRDTEGLDTRADPDGGYTVHLRGRFRHATVRVDAEDADTPTQALCLCCADSVVQYIEDPAPDYARSSSTTTPRPRQSMNPATH